MENDPARYGSADPGPFFHGTKAEVGVGDLLTAGFRSNYRPEVVMNHIYFSALRDPAGLAAELAAGDAELMRQVAERVEQGGVDVWKDVGNGIIKSVVFGIAVTFMAVLQGYSASPTPEGVSRATTRMVVVASLMVLGLDFLLTALMFSI